MQRDFRIHAYTTLAEDFTNPSTGVVHSKGTEVLAVSTVYYGNAHTLQFPLPNMTALFLDQSYVAWAASQTLLREEQFLSSPSKYLPAGTLMPKDDAAFFTLLEHRMVAIVFAYTALESFANESIPEDHIFQIKRDDGKCTEVYTKAQTELLNLDIKLKQVLPPIFGVTSPSGGRP